MAIDIEDIDVDEVEKTEPTEKKAKPKAKKPKEEKKEPKPSKEEELQKKVDELTEMNLRIRAEYDNYRKRSTKEKESAWNDSKASVLTDILPVIDTFERALAADGDYDSLKKGMDMIYTNFMNIFEKLGVTSFAEAGDTFDPNIHNAVMHIEDEEHGEGEIIAVFSKGYKIGEKIVRPAMVQVAN